MRGVKGAATPSNSSTVQLIENYRRRKYQVFLHILRTTIKLKLVLKKGSGRQAKFFDPGTV